MSYDLSLRSGDEPVDLDAVRRWFTHRPRWRIEDSQAFYENDETGVYFIVDMNPESAGDREQPALTAVINVYRPSFFIREIEPELSRLIDAFGLRVEDPHGDTGPSTPATLRNGWLEANADAHRIFASQDPDAARLPTQRLTALWRWNFDSSRLQESILEDEFVPRIMVFRVAGVVSTAVVWTDGIPTWFPRVDGVLLYRQDYAPRRLFRRAEDTRFVPWAELESVIGRHSVALEGGGLRFTPPTVPPDVASWLRGLPYVRDPGIAGVPFDQLHDTDPPRRLED